MPLWTNRYNGPASRIDQAAAIAVDAAGNVFVTGQSMGIGGDYDYATIKYSSAGTPLWTNRYSDPAGLDDIASGVALDTNGNAYVTGQSKGPGGVFGYATVKYSSAGTPLWTNRYNAPADSSDQATAIAVDKYGNVFVTGSSFDFSSSFDYATIKYSSAGTALWTNRYNGPVSGIDQATAIAADTNGNVFVTGFSEGNGTGFDFATLKYSSAGAQLWPNRYNGPGNSLDIASNIVVDASGDVIVTGPSSGGSSGLDYATIRYSSAGTQLWARRYNGPGNGDDIPSGIAVDAVGNVCVTGSSVGSAGIQEFATVAYSSAGVALWTNRYHGPGKSADSGNAIAADGKGNVYVTGASFNAGDVNTDYATIGYSSAGVPFWTNRYNGPANNFDAARAVAVDKSGSVYVTGQSIGNGTGYDYATLKYAGVPGPIVITNAVLAGTNLVFSGTGGSAGGTYYVLASTNVAEPAANWGRVATNRFDASGGFRTTNSTDLKLSSQFFRLRLP